MLKKGKKGETYKHELRPVQLNSLFWNGYNIAEAHDNNNEGLIMNCAMGIMQYNDLEDLELGPTIITAINKFSLSLPPSPSL